MIRMIDGITHREFTNETLAAMIVTERVFRLTEISAVLTITGVYDRPDNKQITFKLPLPWDQLENKLHNFMKGYFLHFNITESVDEFSITILSHQSSLAA